MGWATLYRRSSWLFFSTGTSLTKTDGAQPERLALRSASVATNFWWAAACSALRALWSTSGAGSCTVRSLHTSVTEAIVHLR